MPDELKISKPVESRKSKTLVSKGSSPHSFSATYTREEIRLLMEKYLTHKLKR